MPSDLQPKNRSLDYHAEIPGKINWQHRVGSGLHIAGWILFVLALMGLILVESGSLRGATKTCYIATHVFIGEGMLTGLLAFLFGRPVFLIVFFAHLALAMFTPIIEFR